MLRARKDGCWFCRGWGVIGEVGWTMVVDATPWCCVWSCLRAWERRVLMALVQLVASEAGRQYEEAPYNPACSSKLRLRPWAIELRKIASRMCAVVYPSVGTRQPWWWGRITNLLDADLLWRCDDHLFQCADTKTQWRGTLLERAYVSRWEYIYEERRIQMTSPWQHNGSDECAEQKCSISLLMLFHAISFLIRTSMPSYYQSKQSSFPTIEVSPAAWVHLQTSILLQVGVGDIDLARSRVPCAWPPQPCRQRRPLQPRHGSLLMRRHPWQPLWWRVSKGVVRWFSSRRTYACFPPCLPHLSCPGWYRKPICRHRWRCRKQISRRC